MNRNRLSSKVRQLDASRYGQAKDYAAPARSASGTAIVTAVASHGTGSIVNATDRDTGESLQGVSCATKPSVGQVVSWTRRSDGTVELQAGGGAGTGTNTTTIVNSGDTYYILCGGYGTSEA